MQFSDKMKRNNKLIKSNTRDKINNLTTPKCLITNICNSKYDDSDFDDDELRKDLLDAKVAIDQLDVSLKLVLYHKLIKSSKLWLYFY